MARRALILVGDSTSHGGAVLEGAATDTLDGRAIACVGHRVSCPKCKGDFPIVPDTPSRMAERDGQLVQVAPEAPHERMLRALRGGRSSGVSTTS